MIEVGVYSDGLAHLTLDACLAFCAERRVRWIEFGTGNWSPAPHLNLQAFLDSRGRRESLLGQLAEHDIGISALNCSGNPLHPGAIGLMHADVIRNSIRLASLLGLDRVVTMSGLPAAPGDRHPNWIITSGPPQTSEILAWQWDERLIPFWKELARFAADHGVRLCLEMHGSQCVYNVESLQRLRSEASETIGVNFDPSHLLWMGADPILAASQLAGLIHHVHAKDVRIEPAAAVNSRLDAKPALPVEGRSWNFVAVGKGRDAQFWQALVEVLEEGGYDGPLSIENEDHALRPAVAVDQAIRYLQDILAQHEFDNEVPAMRRRQ